MYDETITVIVIRNFRCVRLVSIRDRLDILHVSLGLSFEIRYLLHYNRKRFCKKLYVLCFFVGNSPASEFYMPTFRKTLFHLHRHVGVEWLVILHLSAYEDETDRVFQKVEI